MKRSVQNFAIYGLLFTALTILMLSFRMIPHPANFTPIGAVAILMGMLLRPRYLSLSLAVLMLFISDVFVGLYSGMLFVYFAYALSVLFSSVFLNRVSWAKAGLALTASSLIFFVVSNFGVWMAGGLYPKTGEGLLSCYIAAIPFFKNSLAANLIFGLSGFAALRSFKSFEVLNIKWVS